MDHWHWAKASWTIKKWNFSSQYVIWIVSFVHSFHAACSGTTKLCWKLALGRNQWVPMPDMLYEHEGATSCHIALKGEIMIVGGLDPASERRVHYWYNVLLVVQWTKPDHTSPFPHTISNLSTIGLPNDSEALSQLHYTLSWHMHLSLVLKDHYPSRSTEPELDRDLRHCKQPLAAGTKPALLCNRAKLCGIRGHIWPVRRRHLK